jgi:hypothetical protein
MVSAFAVVACPVCGKQDPEPVMIKVFESVGEPANLFDDQVDGFGAAIADAVGVEVGQDLCFPGAEGAAQPGDFGDWAAVEAVEHLDRDLAALSSGWRGRWSAAADNTAR